MEHIFVEVQLCIKISIFKEILNIDILIILCLGTSQPFRVSWRVVCYVVLVPSSCPPHGGLRESLVSCNLPSKCGSRQQGSKRHQKQ